MSGSIWKVERQPRRRHSQREKPDRSRTWRREQGSVRESEASESGIEEENDEMSDRSKENDCRSENKSLRKQKKQTLWRQEAKIAQLQEVFYELIWAQCHREIINTWIRSAKPRAYDPLGEIPL